MTVGFHPKDRMKHMCRIAASLLLFVCCINAPIIQAAHQENGQTFDGPGGELYYEAIGNKSGAPLVVINGGYGFTHDHLHAATAWGLLSQDRTVVFYDRFGTGRSSPLEAGQSCSTCKIADQVADIEALRLRLGAEKLDLLGHSMGGYISMAYAAQHPNRVEHLIVVGSPPPKFHDWNYLGSQVFPDIEDNTRRAIAEKKSAEVIKAENFRGFLFTLFYSPDSREAYIEQMKVLPGGNNEALERVVLVDLDAGKYDFTTQMRQLKVPTLVVTGRFDMVVPPLNSWQIHQQIPGSRFLVLDRSGHMPFYEEPELFASTVGTFLAEQSLAENN